MNCAIYIRKSREDKNKPSHRLTIQREQLPQHAINQGWTPHIYDEGHASAAKGKADNLVERTRLINDIRKGQIQLVLVIELSRLSRDDTLEDYLSWLNLCGENQVKLATPSRVLDPAQHSDWMLLLMEGGFSSVEMKVLQDRMAQGRQEALEKGKWLGGTPPPPYRYDKALSRPVVDNEKLEACQDIWHMVTTMSAKAVAERVGKAEITIRRMIADDRLLMYQAKRTHPTTGELIECDWESVMTAEQANQIAASRKTRKTNTTRRIAASLLSALEVFYCGYCERTVKTWSNSKTRADGTRYDYYGCQSKNIKNACPKSRTIQQRDVDGRIVGNLLATLSLGDDLKTYWQAEQSAVDTGGVVAETMKRLKAENKKKSNLIGAIAEGVLEFAEAKTQIQIINDQIQACENDIRNQKAAQVPPPDWSKLTLSLADWEVLDLLEQRRIIKVCIANIKLYNSYAIITYHFPRTATGNRQARVNLPPKHPNHPKKRPSSTWGKVLKFRNKIDVVLE